MYDPFEFLGQLVAPTPEKKLCLQSTECCSEEKLPKPFLKRSSVFLNEKLAGEADLAVNSSHEVDDNAFTTDTAQDDTKDNKQQLQCTQAEVADKHRDEEAGASSKKKESIEAEVADEHSSQKKTSPEEEVGNKCGSKEVEAFKGETVVTNKGGKAKEKAAQAKLQSLEESNRVCLAPVMCQFT